MFWDTIHKFINIFLTFFYYSRLNISQNYGKITFWGGNIIKRGRKWERIAYFSWIGKKYAYCFPNKDWMRKKGRQILACDAHPLLIIIFWSCEKINSRRGQKYAFQKYRYTPDLISGCTYSPRWAAWGPCPWWTTYTTSSCLPTASLPARNVLLPEQLPLSSKKIVLVSSPRIEKFRKYLIKNHYFYMQRPFLASI